MKIGTDLANTVTDAKCLHMEVLPVYATVGPEGLCPILLVFGVIPGPTRPIPSPTQL